MKRTSIVAEEELLLAMRSIAQSEGKSLSDVVRQALTEYVAARRKRSPRKPSFAGAGRSGGKLRISEDAEDLLFQERRRG